MKTTTKRMVLLVFLFYITTGKAQYAITTAGKSTYDSAGEISYTVGQIAFETTKNSNGSIAAGVQQPFEITTVLSNLSNPDFSELNIKLMAYPNPAVNNITLNIKDGNKHNLYCQIIDINGKLLLDTKITENETSIQMENYTKSTYFLKITQDNKQVKIFKIIKN
jgi:hypothetical protein